MRGEHIVRDPVYYSPVDDVKAESSTLLHHVSKVFVKLRSSSGDVQGRDGGAVFDDLSRDGHISQVGTNVTTLKAWRVGRKTGTQCSRHKGKLRMLLQQQRLMHDTITCDRCRRLLRFYLIGRQPTSFQTEPNHQKQDLTSMHRSATSLLTISFRWGEDSTWQWLQACCVRSVEKNGAWFWEVSPGTRANHQQPSVTRFLSQVAK